MKVFDFDYEKKNGDKSERKVMSLSSNDKWIDGIDLEKLTDDEVKELKKVQLKYENDIRPFSKKGFRRFLKEGMTITHEETIKE